MADRNFQSTNSTIIIDHTKISTPTNILIKGTDQVPERKNLLCKALVNRLSLDNISNSNYIQRYDSVFVFSNKASNKRVAAKLQLWQVKSYLGPDNADKIYTLTYKINRIENFKGISTLRFFNGITFQINSSMTGIFSVTGTVTKANFNNNSLRLLEVDINTDNILENDKEVIIEIEILSFELGDHINDPLLYLPNDFLENGIGNIIKETPLISNNSLITAGKYRLEGEVSLFLQEIEKLIEKNYDFFSPNKKELNLEYILSGRL